MIYYENDVLKAIQKGHIPKQVFIHLNNAFISIDKTKDLNLFDIKRLKSSGEFNRSYYRLRKFKYRAIFYIEKNDIYVIKIGSRGEVYKK